MFTPVPQLLRSVRFGDGEPLERRSVKQAIEDGEARLGTDGRLVIRKSGTEPVIRVMAEGEDEELVAAVVDEICAAILAAAIGTEETGPHRLGSFGQAEAGGIAVRGRVLIIAGSDSGGGAGIQADIKTVTMLDAYAATAITALTAQNTEGVFGVLPIPPDFIRAQIEVVLDDIGADAVKTGMLHDRRGDRDDRRGAGRSARIRSRSRCRPLHHPSTCASSKHGCAAIVPTSSSMRTAR